MKRSAIIFASIMAFGTPAFAGAPTAVEQSEHDMAKVQRLSDCLQNLMNAIEVNKTARGEFTKSIGHLPELDMEGQMTWFFPVEGTEVIIKDQNGETISMPMTLRLRVTYNANNIITQSEISLLDRFN